MAAVDLLSFTEANVRRLTELTIRQLRYWDTTGFFSPASNEEGVRLYSFRDLVGLRVIAVLRRKLPLQQLRRVGAYLSKVHATPWSSIAFYIAGNEVFFDDPKTGKRLSTKPTGQRIELVQMKRISAEMKRAAAGLRERTAAQRGEVARSRRVAHNAYVIAGTRIPTSLVWRLKEAGMTDTDILREYPTLDIKDLQAALAFEGDKTTRRKSG